MKAFKLGDDQLLALERDATPMASGSSLLFKVLLWVFIIIVVLMVFRCGSNDHSGSGFRTGGGSYGGYSSGGGHK